ncbi:MAG: hypothetical protein QOF07_434 [Bradyrhizobium sp.]|nr:hypothetical protein [Bradyrhizobium sp.]
MSPVGDPRHPVRAALQTLLAGATLPISPAAKTGQTGMRDGKGNDEACCKPVRRPSCAARRIDGIGPIQLSEPAGEDPGRLHARHGPRPCGPHSCRPVFGSMGHAVRRREYSRRRQQHCHRSRRQSGGRRLQLADGRQLVAGHQPEPVRNPAVRPAEGFRTDQPGIHRGERARRSAGTAGQDRGRTRGASQGTTRPAFLWPCRRGHIAAPGRRIVQIHGAGRYRRSALSRHHGADA